MTMVTSATFSFKNAHAAIVAVRSLDLSTVSVDEIKTILAPAIEGRVMRAPILNVGTTVCRARVMRNGKPLQICELSYPAASLTSMGRVNRVGAPVLYCSASREGALYEVAPAVDDTVAIAQWKTTAPMVVNHVGYSQSAFHDLGSRRTPDSWANLVEEPGGPEHGEVTDFLAATFVRRIATHEADHYKVSIAIAELLFAQDLFHGLIYPTIAMAANSDNVAIKPAFADRHLQFIEAEFFRVQAVREMRFEVLPLDIAKGADESGALEWRGRPKQLTVRPGEPLVLTAENGRWVARDRKGQIIEPD